MLSRELMGLFALAVLWVNTLLIAAAAGQALRAIARRRLMMRPLAQGEVGVGLLEGEVTRGEPLARRLIDQVGRQAADSGGRQAILFHDRSYRGELVGGAVRVGDEELEVVATTGAPVEIWIDPAAMATAASCPDESVFDAAYGEACKARGHGRVVIAEVRPGAQVWLVGERRKDGTIQPPTDGELLVATTDPRQWCGRQITTLSLFIVGVFVAAAVCTGVALYPPHFGLVSTIGGGLGLTYFLAVQPLATMVRDLTRLPSVATLRGTWMRPR